MNNQISPDAEYVTSRLGLGINPTQREVSMIQRHMTLLEEATKSEAKEGNGQ